MRSLSEQVQVVSLVGQQREADGFRAALAGDFEGRDRSPNHDASGNDDLIFLHDPVLVSSVFAWVHCRGHRLQNLHTCGSRSAGAPEGHLPLSESDNSAKGNRRGALQLVLRLAEREYPFQ
jgi:hypothetical protein